MAKETYVTVNSRANIFHDQSTGITIVKGEVKKLNDYQLNSKRVRNALASGHLVYAQSQENTLTAIEEEAKKPLLKEKFINMYKSGADTQKLTQGFSLSDLKLVAEAFDLSPESNDTKATLVEAILKEIAEAEAKKANKK